MLPPDNKGIKEEVWMDTTSEVAPFRLLAYSLRKKQALVIPPVNPPSSVAPHLQQTPADTPMPDSESSEIVGKINDIGKLEAHVHYEFRGDEELLLRSSSQLAAGRRERELRSRWRHHQSQGQRSRGHP